MTSFPTPTFNTSEIKLYIVYFIWGNVAVKRNVLLGSGFS